MFDRLLLTCEHGGNRIPGEYVALFRKAGRTLETHRGLDIGSLSVARILAQRLSAPLFSSTISRLLVDLNRSPAHPRLFSEYSSPLGAAEKTRIVRRHYLPYRSRVEEAIVHEIGGGLSVLHLSVHSFTPVLNRVVRRADIGLLYDPARAVERETCRRLQRAIRSLEGALVVRRNYPYRGTADGLTTYLRRRVGSVRYAGVEIEINQARLGTARERRNVAMLLGTAIGRELDDQDC